MHTCPALLLSCMDWRLHPRLEELVRARVGGLIDVVTIPGAVQSLLDAGQPAVRDYVLHSIDISVRLHGIQRVALVNHTDCGAYGGRQAFASDPAELARHQADLRAARQLVGSRFPGIAVELLLATLHEVGGGWQVRLDEVD